MMQSKDTLKMEHVILNDTDKKRYIYSKAHQILIPFDQDLSKRYKLGQRLPEKNITLDGKTVSCRLPDGSWAADVFTELGKMRECREWKIRYRLWKTAHTETVYDDGVLRRADPGESFFVLQCIYLEDEWVDLLDGYEGSEDGYDDLGLDECLWKMFGLSPETGENTGGGQTVRVKSKKPEKTKDIPKPKEYSPDIDALLKCDYRRCRSDPYERSILFDVKKGHWDIYDPMDDSGQLAKEGMVSRDPRKDIRAGVVGIDLGAKSTVVVTQDETNKITPVRMGTGRSKTQIRPGDYENPTIIECNDLQSFLKAYGGEKGRPETSWDDLLVSHHAYSDHCMCPPKEFYAYHTDIKQWADREIGTVIVQDKKNRLYRFSSETSEEEKTIDPIELYAYHIGMYINNMRNGIYMRYLLSYPVSYSKETRDLILGSFEKGIKKSLPTVVLEDEDCMKRFSVKFGISEQAAYAVTALGLNGLDPKDEHESYMYGVFDLGGGTTDLDFGSWRGASEHEYDVEGYDYVLECFSADSDPALGGEHILEMLAYTVFKENADIARDKHLVCALPASENAFLGSEILLSDSQIAMCNMLILKEGLRPLWHQEEGWKEKYMAADEHGGPHKGVLETTLYNTDGEKVPDCKLTVDVDKLIGLAKARIKKGVDFFFRCLEKVFQSVEKAREEEKVYIFLAGNTCRSKFVKEIFELKIQEYYRMFKKISPDAVGSYFELIEPLEDRFDGSTYIPNGKTGVAYGLVKSREGSMIKIVKDHETDPCGETRFKYYIGRERRRTFDCRLSPEKTAYNEWIKFQGAVKAVIRVYYTTDPTADTQRCRLDIEDIKYKEIEILPEEGKFFFIRAVKPTVIEYAVAYTMESISKDEKIEQLDLGI